MFFYISFLKPPPLCAYPSSHLKITPQIANDLRTENFTRSQDIYYSWSKCPSPSNSSLQTTKPLKLTTWRQETSYKEIPLPLPPGIRNGESWRLILSAQPQSQPYTVNLSNKSLGAEPFPALSIPIRFGGPDMKQGKQEQIERIYRLSATPDDARTPRLMTITEKTSFDLDKKIWDSGIGLSSWIVESRDTTAKSLLGLQDALFSSESRKILELGAGTGIVALTIAAERSAKSSKEDTIITTDLESAMPLLKHNIILNGHLYDVAPVAEVLDWDEELPEHITASDGFDAVLMADVTYNTASFPSLINTLQRLTRLGTTPPLILLGYKERDQAERSLWTLAAEIGIIFEKVGERGGAGGNPVEIWLGKYVVPSQVEK